MISKEYYYDLHIHTALSPCAEEEMTPNNIVNMAILKGLDFIAITDHNSAGNVEAVLDCAGEKDIIVIPGIEVESIEEVHMLCLFPSLLAVKKMEDIIKKYLPDIQNRSEIFGEQILYNRHDEMIGRESQLLVTAISLSLERLKRETEKLGGVMIPSHIDRSSYSVLSNLGFIPDELCFNTIEVSQHIKENELLIQHPYLKEYRIINNSDAHSLGNISEAEHSIFLKEKSRKCMINTLSISNFNIRQF